MGTIDDDDATARLLFPARGEAEAEAETGGDDALPSPSSGAASAASARFMGTVDEFDFDRFASGSSASAPSRGPPTPPAVPPADGDPDLAFLYDPASLAAVAGLSLEDTLSETNSNWWDSPEVVARCDASIRRCASMDQVLDRVREMTRAGVRPRDSTYYAVMRACRDAESVGAARAIEVYDAMRLNAARPSRKTLELAVECACKAGQAGHALRLKRDATEVYRYPLGPRLLTMILRCVADNDVGSKRGAKHRLVRACKLFEEMLEAAEREREDREEEEDEEEEDGNEDSPSSSSPSKNRVHYSAPPPAAFHALLLAASRAKQSDLVARTYEEMVAAGISPSRETYECVLGAAAKGGLADVALDVFASMRSDGFAARKSTYNSLLEACAKAPQPRAEQAFEIFNVMVAEGTIAPNARTFALLVEAAGASGSPALARDALASAEAAGVDVSLATRNQFIAASGADVSAALEALEAIEKRAGLEPDVFSYGGVLGACAKAGDADAATETEARMLARLGEDAHNRVTRHAVIAALGRAGRWREALGRYAEGMRGSDDPKKEPARETFAVLYDAACGPGGAESAASLAALEADDFFEDAETETSSGGESGKKKSGGFLRSERAAAARAVFRDAVRAGAYDVSVASAFAEDARFEKDVSAAAYAPSGSGTRLRRVDLTHMTRGEATVAALALLERFASSAGGGAGEEKTPAAAAAAETWVVAAGPGTRGNAQRRMLAVESVFRAARLPYSESDDPGEYAVVVDAEGMARWAEKTEPFARVELEDVAKKAGEEKTAGVEKSNAARAA